jgi:hypothetical protein
MNASKVTEQSRRQYADLDSRYGKIGISAVVAALQYQGEPSRRPSVTRIARTVHHRHDIDTTTRAAAHVYRA